MTIRPSLLAACAALVLGVLGNTQTSAPAQTKSEHYTFRRPLINGRGVSRLADLQGKPVLIEYWSHACSPCTGVAVPAALRMQQEFGDDIQVILVEVGGVSDQQLASYVLGKGWMGSPAMWTTERPVRTEEVEIPSFVLLSTEGEVALKGLTDEHQSSLDDAVGGLIRSKPPKELPRGLNRAWTECNDGNYAKAHDIASKFVEDERDDGVKRAAGERVLKMIRERLDSRFQRVGWMMDNGYPIEAMEMLDELRKGVKGMAKREEAIRTIEQRLATPEMKLEVEAQKALAKVEKKLYEDPSVRYVKQLQKIVEKYPRTKSAERASKLVKVAGI
ncbi:MAG: hypothetical protein AAF682_00540 [Planctomycetota bacterium]